MLPGKTEAETDPERKTCKTEAETGGMRPQVKEHQSHQKAEEARNGFPPRSTWGGGGWWAWGELACRSLDVWPSEP